MLKPGQLGIHPAGALGVGFFIHAGAECFIGRSGGGITQLVRETGSLKILEGSEVRVIPLKNRIFTNLLETDALGHLPELVLVCCDPGQLRLVTGDLTTFIENLASRDCLRSDEDIRRHIPILLVLPNGILSEETIQTYSDQLNDALLMDRLPGITEQMIQTLLDRVVRGVSLQAGGRRGHDAETQYIIEKKGALVFAGSGELETGRIEEILTAHGYPYTHVFGVPGTRIEFDKAMISIVINVGGLIHAVKPRGELIDLRMGDLCKDRSKDEFVHEVTRAVFDVGKAIGAYPEDALYEDVWEGHKAIILKNAEHVTSSIKGFRDALDEGLDDVTLFGNEEWVLTPLSRYAAKAGMPREAALFQTLRRSVQQAMARAIKYRDEISRDGGSRRRNMKLAAQRNISIDLLEAGKDDVVLVGTFLDNDHLVKLEINVYLPDEQITRSQLDMIRTPFPVCHEVETVAERLVGLRIERGVIAEIGRRIGGRVGCSHINELATSIVHFVASYLVRRRIGVEPFGSEYAHKPPGEQFVLTKELLRDTCLAYSQTTPQALDKQIGIKRIGEEHASPIPLGSHESSMGQLLSERSQRWSDRVFLRYREGKRKSQMTWAEFGSGAFQIARHLIEQGIQPGDRIGVVCENRAEMFLLELAAMSIGAVSIPVFAGYTPAQVSYVLEHARPRYIIVSGRHQLDKIERDRYPWVEKFYCMDFDDACKAWGALDFASLTTRGGATATELEKRMQAVQPDDLCVIMYTSGTTGSPKGVCLSHRNLISQQKAIALLWDVTEKDVFMSYLPWHHSFGGLFERFMSLYQGCEMCLDDSRGRDIGRLIDNWKTFKPTMFFSVPRVHAMLLARCREVKAVARMVFDGRLRLVFTAGASLPADVEATYREHGIQVLEGWGLTETSPCVTVTSPESDWRSGYVGHPIPGVTVRVDSDQEILVKGPNVMQSYLDDEDATSRVIDDDGWLHTGDLGEFTKHGVRIFGRKDGAFKLTSGEKVHPQRVEDTLVNESQYIESAVVVGSGKDYVSALIYPALDQLYEWTEQHGIKGAGVMDQPQVREFFASELGRVNMLTEIKYQRIKRVILIDREPSMARGELTPTSKIVRHRVLETYHHELKELFDPNPPNWVIEIVEHELQAS